MEKLSVNDLKDFVGLMKDNALITAGDINDHNTMTIGWGTIGVLWSKEVFIAYVKPCRYTHTYLENNDYFSICYLDDHEILSYCGKKSGKDVNKDKECGLNAFNIDDTIAYSNSKLIITCKKIYRGSFDKNQIRDDSIVNKYYTSEKEHDFYVGEIIGVYKV